MAGARATTVPCMVLALALLLTAVASASSSSASFGVLPLEIRVGCTTPTGATRAERAGGSWRRQASFAVPRPLDAHFLVLRIARLRLPPGATLTMRDYAAPGTTSLLTFHGEAKTDWRVPDVALYTRPLAAHGALLIEYVVSSAIDGVAGACYGVHIDELRYAARAAPRVVSAVDSGPLPLSSTRVHKEARVDALSNTDTVRADACLGGADAGGDEEKGDGADGGADGALDSSARAACVRFDAAVFAASRAVARLLVHKPGGSVFCTGWLVGCEGHVLTNHHCVGSQREADATAIEFLAQGRACNESCETPMGCPGVVEATHAQLVAHSPLDKLDFALLLPRLPRAQRQRLVDTYGSLAMRAPRAGERIFIPQHPAGFGKRVALKCGAGYGRVESLADAGCNARRESLAYRLATRGGSSGAPVIAYADRAVVGLHYCGGCLNSAIPAHRIVAALVDAGQLPQCARADDEDESEEEEDESKAPDKERQ